MTVVFCQVGPVRVVETTCFGSPFSAVATGLSGVGDLGPVGLHHAVGRPAEQELIGLVESRRDDPGASVVRSFDPTEAP
jgi:hypothetical protein